MLNYLKQIAFGLDIGSSAISALKIARKRGRLVLSGFCRSALPPGLISAGRIQDENHLAEHIKKTAAGSRPRGISDLFVNLALPEQSSFLRLVQLPQMKPEEVAEAIKWEIEANIPFSIDSVYSDWRILDAPFGKNDHLDILVAAVPKETAESYIRAVKNAGFFPKSLEIDSFSLCRSLIPGLKSDVSILIVELSPNQATLVVFSGSAPLFSSSVPLSGRHFAELAAGEWGLAKKKRKKADSAAGKNPLPIFANFLTEQVQSYREFYEEHAGRGHKDGAAKIDKIILCGSGLFAGLADLLAERLEVETVVGNPFINISSRPKTDFSLMSSVEESLALAKVLGLAARDYIV